VEPQQRVGLALQIVHPCLLEEVRELWVLVRLGHERQRKIRHEFLTAVKACALHLIDISLERFKIPGVRGHVHLGAMRLFRKRFAQAPYAEVDVQLELEDLQRVVRVSNLAR
jgi:hypothetical protein